MAEILETLPKFQDPNLLVVIETSDDGAVYRVSEDVALIQTLDFFPPMVEAVVIGRVVVREDIGVRLRSVVSGKIERSYFDSGKQSI